MNATKRKFNALLNGIGNKSNTSLSAKEVNNASNVDLSANMGSTTASDADSQAKKRRISPSASSPAQNTFSKSTSSTNGLSTITHKKSASLASGTLATETPKYAPWDRAAFLTRLKTFSNITDWTPKPARVSEVEWAKRGWVCQKLERVRCCLCNVEILVKLNRKEVDGKDEPVYVAQNIENALVDKYVELIVTSHDEDCLWRKRGCDDSIFKLPLNHTPTTLQTLRQRYDELSARNETLPYEFNLRTPPRFDVDTALKLLPNDFFNTPSEDLSTESSSPREVNKVAFQMALCGWQGYTHDRLGVQLGSVSCQACFRVLGLWLFKSKEVSETGEEVEGGLMSRLNVVTEHRDYCPWRNAASQNGVKATSKEASTSLAGWEVVLRVLKNDYYLRHHGERHKDSTSKEPPSSDNIDGSFGADTDAEDAKNREEKDNERWARLRRVKSLFDTKAGKKLQRTATTEAKGHSGA